MFTKTTARIARWSRSHWALPLLVFMLGLAVAVSAGLWMHRQVNRDLDARFQREATAIGQELVNRFRQPVYEMAGARAAYASHGTMRGYEFRAYVESRDLPRDFHGVRGFGFIERVERGQVAAFVAAQRADGEHDFSVRQLVDKGHPDLLVVKFIEPGLRNQGVQGLDVGSEARRRVAAERAIDTGEPSMSEVITLVQDDGRRPGVVLFVPVYANGERPQNVAARRARLVGLIFAPIVIEELLGSMQDMLAGRLDLALFKVPAAPEKETLVYAMGQALQPAGGVAQAGRIMQSRAALAAPLQGLTLQLRSTSQFTGNSPQLLAWFVFTAGALGSALLAGVVWSITRARALAESRAAGMTSEIARLAMVVRHTSNAVSVMDRQMRIEWVNDGFTRLCGYSLEQALGKTPGVLLGSGKTGPAVLRTLAESAVAGLPCRVEILNRSRDGLEYWVDTEVQPLRDSQGVVTGFMEISTDISLHRRAQLQLEAALRDSRAVLDALNLHAIISETDGEGRILSVNDAFCTISGYAREELIGRTHQIVNSGIQPKAFWASMWRLVKNGTPWRGQVCNRARDGTLYWVDTFIAPFRAADGSIERIISIRVDITASKHAERKVERQRQTLTNIIEGTGAGTWEWNVESGELSLNPHWADMLGYTLADLGASGIDTWKDLLHPQDQVQFAARTERHWDGGLPELHLECRMRHKEGHWMWVQVRGKLFGRSADGRPRWMAGTMVDIHQQHVMALELAQRRVFEISVLENLPCGLSVFDADLRLVASNRAFGQLLGLPDALVDTTVASFEDIIRFNADRGEYGTENLEATVQAIVERARAPAVPHQFERVRQNGTALDVRGAPMPGGGFITTYTDVSAQRRAEAEVRKNTELLRGAIEAIDEAFVLYDPQDRLVFCNDKYRQLYAASADLIVPGAGFAEILRRAAERGQYAQAVGRVEEWVAEQLLAHCSGNQSLVQRLDDGRTLRVVERTMPDGHTVGFRIDITELVRATERAQEASASKSQFLANMSHEIRTPMNAVLGMLALLRKTELSARQADYAAKSEGAARSLLHLLNDILDFSKVEAGKMTLDPQPFRLDALLRDLAVICAAGVGAKPVEMLFDIDASVPRRLVGDAPRLQQVLTNLTGNALKFTATGEVVLSIRLLATQDDAVTLQFAVRDTGIGIAPENQQRIFSGFTQAEASTTRRFGGTGLGVAISQRMVGLMGGQLELDSALGAGSRFHFRLELLVAPPDAVADMRDTGSTMEPLHVLAVDDHASARELLQRMGQSLGWQVDMAQDGEAALRMLQERGADANPYQVVFMDWQMPGMDGWQTVQRMRSMVAPGPAPLVVMISAHGREALAGQPEMDQALLDGYLVKPVTASMLFDAVMDARATRGQPRRASLAPVAQARRLAGVRILLAEDNLNNQQVARELLEDEGAVVQIANHGQEAVDALAATPSAFDVVLMDLQMPVMDGFAATVYLRQTLGLRDLPVVAMTANAMASDRDASLAAGMNDHVGKPFDLDHLVAVLRQQTGNAALVASAQVVSDPRWPDAWREAALAAGVNLAQALQRLGGKVDVYQRLLRRFVDDLPGMSQALRTGLELGDEQEAGRVLHTLKGLAATMGADRLAASAADAERRVHMALPSEQVHVMLGQLLATVAEVTPAMARLVQVLAGTAVEPSAAAPDVQNPDQALPWLPGELQTIAALLEDADMAATDAMAHLLGRLPGPVRPGLQALDDAINALDFELALQLCTALVAELTQQAPV